MSSWSKTKGIIEELWRGKSSRIGIILLVFYIFLAILAPIIYPYSYVTKYWNDPTHWQDNPRLAQPVWVNYFIGKNLPETIIIDSRNLQDKRVYKQENIIGGFGFKEINIVESFTYEYDDFPSEITLIVFSNFSGGFPFVSIYFQRPDGKEIQLISSTITSPKTTYYISQDPKIINAITDFVKASTNVLEVNYTEPQVALFAEAKKGMESYRTAKVLKGLYGLRVNILMQDPNGTADAKLIVYGKVYGLAGTDNFRRDLMIGLLWGDPVAISFGLTASLLITIIQTFIAIAATWKGGLTDSIVQRIVEIYMVVPFLNILIIISMFYKLSIWTLLIAVVVLSIFGGGMKGTRSLIMQVKEETYIEAATSYGASDLRIVLFYLWPRILPTIVPGLIGAVPGYIFLEAGLAFLGLGDPTLPTWGKMLNDAYSLGAVYQGYWWWILLPIVLIFGIAIAFATIGYSLEKILNPRLREE
ncbi:MAG: ABC transporter permease [Thermoproteota archaeon]